MRIRTLGRSLTLYVIIGLLLAACGGLGSGSPDVRRCISYGNLSVCDPILDFYRQHGGATVFGYPLTGEVRQGDMVVQYLENAVVQHPADDPRLGQVHLRSLGLELSKPTSPEIPRDDPDCHYFERYGHFVCLSFLEFFDRIGGEEVVGQPISRVMVEDGVRVQHFENAKFRWAVESGPPRAALAAWGKQVCLEDGMVCQNYGYAGLQAVRRSTNEIAADIERFAAAHGGDGLLGQRIGQLVYAGDVAYQYYQNACLLWTPGVAEPVALAPLGSLAAPDVPRIDPPPPSDTMRYFPATGHSVVLAFLDFYLHYGDEPVFGLPLTEFMEEGNLWVQWFENVRLEWHPESPYGERVKLGPLGEASHSRFGGGLPSLEEAGLTESPAGPLPQGIVLRIVPKYPILPLGETQMINVLAQDYAGRPLPGVVTTLYFSTSASQQLLTVPSTDRSGSAWVRLDTVEGECGEVMRLRAVTKTADSTALADGQFTLWCDPTQ